MVGDVLWVGIGFLLGAGTTALVVRRRRGAERTADLRGDGQAPSAGQPVPTEDTDAAAAPPEDARPAELPAQLRQAVRDLGEELDELDFDPHGPQATPAMAREHRAAVRAYERAASAGSEEDALAALRNGRAALIRLDARRAGRPVPIDALPAPGAGSAKRPAKQPETGTGERYLHTGSGPGTVEVLVDRPEPGRHAIVELIATGDAYMVVEPVIRTEDGPGVREDGRDFEDDLVAKPGAYRGRHLLAPDVTHLRVRSMHATRHRWSARIRPISAAVPLAPEQRGVGDEVLAYEGGPALLTVQVRSETNWKVRFECGCLQGDACACAVPRWPDGARWTSDWVHGLRDGRRTLRLPRPGYVVVHEENTDDSATSWYLTTEPVEVLPPDPAQPKPRKSAKRPRPPRRRRPRPPG